MRGRSLLLSLAFVTITATWTPIREHDQGPEIGRYLLLMVLGALLVAVGFIIGWRGVHPKRRRVYVSPGSRSPVSLPGLKEGGASSSNSPASRLGAQAAQRLGSVPRLLRQQDVGVRRIKRVDAYAQQEAASAKAR